MPNEYINQIQVGTTTYDIQDDIARQNIESLSTSLSTMAFQSDAPSDDKQYGRKNGDWVEIQSSTTYTLPIATSTELGGIKIGNGLSIDNSGVVSVSTQSSGDSGGTWGEIEGDISDQTDLAEILDRKADFNPATASGSMVSITDAGTFPVVGLTISIVPKRGGSGDPSPTNIRPISGWTEVTVSHSGVDITIPDTLTVTFPTEAGTVYSGTLDVTNGVLTVTMASAVFDGSTDEAWTVSTNSSIVISDMMSGNNMPGLANIFSTGSSRGSIRFGLNNNRVYIVGAQDVYNITTIAELRTFLAENNLQVVYPLATPITYTLTPQQMTLLLGENHIWADTGDINVTYKTDKSIDNITITWGSITGTLSDQTDLQDSLNNKVDISQLSNYLPLSGGTMTGGISYSTSIDSTTTPETEINNHVFYILDTNGNPIGNVESSINTSGEILFKFGAVRNINGNNIYNNITCRILSDGTRNYIIADPDAFREALGVTDIATRPNYVISTTDLEENTALTTGLLYFYYSEV